MLTFHNLKIADIHPQTEYATTVVFDVPEELEETFQFRQGQHLNIKASIGGKEIRRSYSLCNAPTEGLWRITVKHVEGGEFSSYVQGLKAGDSLQVMTPNGRFFTQLDSNQRKHYVAFASGSGITPVLSNLRAVLAEEPGSRFTLFFGNRNLRSVLFNEELQDLKNRYLDRLSIHHVFSGEHREFGLYTGRLDADKVNELLDLFCKEQNVDEYLICGPGTMVKDLTQALKQRGVAPNLIHTERFGVQKKKSATQSNSISSKERAKASVSVTMDGHAREFSVYAQDTLLEAAAKAGIELPYSCKAGVCSTCRTKITHGKVTMQSNHALEPWELEQGYVLACQAQPDSDEISLDYD